MKMCLGRLNEASVALACSCSSSRNVDEAGPLAPQLQQNVPVGVHAVSGNPVALLEASREQRVRDSFGPGIRLGVAPAPSTKDEGVLLRVSGRGASEGVADGVAAGALYGLSSASHAPLLPERAGLEPAPLPPWPGSG